jgi:hypothetical protein
MQTIDALIDRIARLEQRLEEMESLRNENERLKNENERLKNENERLRNENERLRNENERLKKRIEELEHALKQYADAKAAKKPKFPLNYSSQRNEPKENNKDDNRQKKNNKDNTRKKAGRKPKETKPGQADLVMDIFPEGVKKSRCILRHEQFVWRLIDHKAKYVHYRIFATADAAELPTIPGVRNVKSGYGIEFMLMLAHHVYWLGLSMDKARELIRFYTDVDIPKSQVDSLLYQLANDWKDEYENIAKRIAVASILYIDETGWKVGKKHCYTWVFGTFADVYYRCGVGRGKDVLTEVLGEKFGGTGVSDDYAAYDSIFSKHQLCWAHFLRKAIELMLRYPENKSYRRFYMRLLLIYRRAKCYREDRRLTTGRAAKYLELQGEIMKLCKRSGEEIVTEKQAEANGWDKSWVTSVPEATMIRLQNELVERRECLFVFVENPAVDGTNNQSERDLRREAQVRKSGNTSKSDKGALRRATIISVFASLSRRIADVTLTNILNLTMTAQQLATSLFNIAKPQETKLS